MDTIGIDIGGTNIKGGVVNNKGKILGEIIQIPTPKRHIELLAGINTVVEKLKKQKSQFNNIKNVGISIAGIVDKDKKTFLKGANLSLKENFDISTSLPYNIYVENDGNTAAYAEYALLDVPKQEKEVTLVIVYGTGVGAGIIINGELICGKNGIAGELGHVNLINNGEKCGCGLKGCYERYASGNAFHNHGENWEEYGQYIGQGLGMYITIFDPDVIIIGGGIGEAFDNYKDSMLESMVEHACLTDFRMMPKIARAKLGNTAGIIGSALLARTSKMQTTT